MAQSTASADKQQVVNTVEALFTALQDNDSVKLHSTVAPDFYLSDNGTRMDADSILAMIIKAKAAGRQFTWTVTEPDVHIEHDFAWIGYLNVGRISHGSAIQDQKWLESGVLEMQSGHWTIGFMHSTRVPVTDSAAHKND